MAYYEQLCKAKEVVVGTMIVDRHAERCCELVVGGRHGYKASRLRRRMRTRTVKGSKHSGYLGQYHSSIFEPQLFRICPNLRHDPVVKMQLPRSKLIKLLPILVVFQTLVSALPVPATSYNTTIADSALSFSSNNALVRDLQPTARSYDTTTSDLHLSARQSEEVASDSGSEGTSTSSSGQDVSIYT